MKSTYKNFWNQFNRASDYIVNAVGGSLLDVIPNIFVSTISLHFSWFHLLYLPTFISIGPI